MINELDDYYKNLERNVGDLSEAYGNLAATISKAAMILNKEQKILLFKEHTQGRLMAIFIKAYESEHYEVCQVIKEILEGREENSN